MKEKDGLLTLYSDIKTTAVNWLWYPYIAIGKITLIQGDPGDGKSTMMMNIISSLSTGGTTPDGRPVGEPMRTIYQCSEDGASDTIKPRLVTSGANCNNVAFINEEVHDGLTLDDERIRDAITQFRPKLVVIDPIQAYLGSDSDLQIAGRARKLLRRLSMWAEYFDCAIVLIGHMNKREGSKGLYRGLGSIDIVASARSVLQVERSSTDPAVRKVVQIKNSLAPSGNDVCFEIRPDTGFRWISAEPESPFPKEISSDAPIAGIPAFKTKREEAAYLIKQLLSERDMPSTEIFDKLSEYGIGEKTSRRVREDLNIHTYRKHHVCYWTLNNEGNN